jgi:hypothetical protein
MTTTRFYVWLRASFSGVEDLLAERSPEVS